MSDNWIDKAIMATEKQVKAVEAMVENGGIVSRAMEEAGYSPNTAKTPQKLTESKGFQEICEEYGLTDSLIIESLVDDIKLKPQNRKPELELGAKIKGMLIDKQEHSGVVEVISGINYVTPNGDNSTTNTEATPGVSSPE